MMSSSGGMMNNSGRTPTTRPTPTSTVTGKSGRELFLASGCGSCHTLAVAATTGSAGPDLDATHPSYSRAVEQITNGGGGMPGFAGSLSRSQIRAIARYVADSTR